MTEAAMDEAVRLMPVPMLADTTPTGMLARAVSAGASIEVLEKLMALQERWEANQARKAFDEAVSCAKAEIPPIQRNATGHNSKKYADFSAIAKIVDPVLSKYGLSYRFRTVQNERINVTCILAHKSGHSEETTLAGPPDSTGSKNAIQAIGSTLTYLQRYSLVQMLGLAASDDDDGNLAGALINEDEIKQLIELADSVGANKEKFCEVMKVPSIADIRANEFKRAIELLNTKKKKAEK